MAISPLPFKSYFKEDRKSKEKKKYKIPVRSKKPLSPIKTNWGFTSQIDMFDYLWAKATKYGKVVPVCEFTGEKLDEMGTMWINQFAHILPKSKYPLWKLNPDNVRIVHPEFHRIVDQGRISDRALHPTWDFAKWDALVEEKKSEYKIFIDKHL